MDWKKIGKVILFPHIAIMIIAVPIATVMLTYSMVFTGTESVSAIISYVLSFYTLLVWCLRIPAIISFFKKFKKENRYVIRWRNDLHLRVQASLYGHLFFNTAYALMHLGMGIRYNTFWFCSLGAYYMSLAVMRFFLLLHTRKHGAGENMLIELKKYRICGIAFLIMNLFIAIMTFFMVYWNRTFRHHEITTIAMATYTFASFALNVVNAVRYRKNISPVYTASMIINLASACVSMLTLEATMLTAFGSGDMEFSGIMLSVSGGIISAFIILTAIYMIVYSTKKIKTLNITLECNNDK